MYVHVVRTHVTADTAESRERTARIELHARGFTTHQRAGKTNSATRAHRAWGACSVMCSVLLSSLVECLLLLGLLLGILGLLLNIERDALRVARLAQDVPVFGG